MIDVWLLQLFCRLLYYHKCVCSKPPQTVKLHKYQQNVKKRFAEILQPKQYKRGAVVFLAIVMLAAVSSGCLQFTEPGTDTKQKEATNVLP